MFNRLSVAINYLKKIYRGCRIPDSWHNLERCDVLLLSHDINRGYVFRNELYAHLIDTIGDHFANKGLIVRSIARPYSIYTLDKAYNRPFSCNRYYFIGQLFSLNTIRVIKKQLINPNLFYVTWNSYLLNKLWVQILKKAKPKIVIGIQPDENLCKAGRFLNIPVYDLQHGFMSNDDPLYGESFQNEKTLESLPNGFLCWDEQSTASLKSWTQKRGIRVITIGNPWFIRFLFSDNNDVLVNDAKCDTKDLFEDNRPSILVSLQWGLHQIYLEDCFHGVMVKALEQTIIETKELYNWVIRLHPAQLRGIESDNVIKYLTEMFGEEKAQLWLNTSTVPLPFILTNVDLHITDSSAIVQEATWVGVRSAILNPEVKTGGKFDFFIHERNIGMAETITQDPEEIKKWISKNLKKGRGKIQFKDTRDIRDAFIKEVVDKCRS